jgi:acetyl esterase/lipase
MTGFIVSSLLLQPTAAQPKDECLERLICGSVQNQHAPRAQNRQSKILQSAKTKIFKSVDVVELKMHIFYPDGHKASDKRAAIVFFFGGGWRGGSPSQFAPHCRYLASRGMVAMAAEYRVFSRHKSTVATCVADAKSAIRWVRRNATELGINPQQIASGGGSAGGHLAAAVALLDGFNEAGEDTSISERPNAMLLFNPALDLTRKGFGKNFAQSRYDEIAARMGAEAKALSPTFHIRMKTPPTIVFHGKADTTVPYAQAVEFQKRMKAQGRRCELVGYDNAAHGFFNFGGSGNKAYVATLTKADQFLMSLGYLKGKPTIQADR